MTIQELFDQLRREPDWSKEVVVFTEYDTVKVKGVIPNIMNDTQLLLEIEEGEYESVEPNYS